MRDVSTLLTSCGIALALALAGCGGSNDNDNGQSEAGNGNADQSSQVQDTGDEQAADPSSPNGTAGETESGTNTDAQTSVQPNSTGNGETEPGTNTDAQTSVEPGSNGDLVGVTPDGAAGADGNDGGDGSSLQDDMAPENGAASEDEAFESAGGAVPEGGEADASDNPEASADEGNGAADNGDDGDDEQEVAKVIKITGDDQMNYNIDSFTVKAGTTVKIDFEHIGKMAKASMGHNVVIVKQDVKPIPFAGLCIANGGNPPNGYLPDKKKIMDKVIAHTDMIGGGQSTSVTFTVPEKKGDYPFLCTYPAHAASTMTGTMKVK